jgi:hypothetical protein
MLETNRYIMTGFAYAAHFFNQYLLLAFPMTAVTMFINRKRPKALLLFSATLGLEIYCLIEGGLRSSMSLIILTLALGAIAGVVYLLGKGARTQAAVAILVMALFAGIGALLVTETLAYKRLTREITSKLDSGKLGGYREFVNDPLYFYNKGITEPRLIMWHAAARMFAHSPLLGVGAGRFTALFREFYTGDPNNANVMKTTATETAHSIYFELLADQGLIGLSLWLGVIVCGMIAGYRALAHSRSLDERAILIGVFALVTIWMLLGLTHHIALCRAIEFIFWFGLGTLAGAGPAPLSTRSFPKSIIVSLSVLLALGAFWQVKNIVERPLPGGFNTGFYQWEGQPDGTAARWTCGTAVMNVEVAGETMTLELSAPLPGIDKKPQVVHINFVGEKREVMFNDASWKTVVFNVRGTPGETRILKIRTEHVVNLSKTGGQDDRDLGVMVKPVKWSPNAP